MGPSTVRRYTIAAGLLLIAGCALVRATAPPPEVAPDAGAPDAGATGDAGIEPPDAGAAIDAGAPPDAGPTALPLDLPPAPDDPLNAAYRKRLDFHRGAPAVPVRLMEGVAQVTFSTRGRLRMKLAGHVEKLVDGAPGTLWTVRIVEGHPAQLTPRIQLAELRLEDRAGLQAEQKDWDARGVKTRVETIGSLYGIAGKVIDNRRFQLLLDERLPSDQVAARQAQIVRQYGVRTTLVQQLDQRPSGILELLDAQGASVALAQDWIVAEPLEGTPVEVRQVEHDVGYPSHAFEDRAYRGSLQLAVDRDGKLAVVNQVGLEDLLRGLVPSEIYARAHPEALKAQAVTARGEVLAKIGTKHLADPYLLCAEQHCAVYKGISQETPATNAAVDATRGEGLFSPDGRLVDSVYSAVCGGHTEDNDVVWGGPPNPSLRGKPDLIGPSAGFPTPANLAAFLSAELPSADRLSTFAQPSKYRWEKHFTADEVNQLTASLDVGPVQAISVVERGVSGRARLLTIAGERGATQIRGELNIRKLFGMLNSAMFLVTPERDAQGAIVAWTFRGGGWGHGVGMCQTGAIGRAEAGQDYRAILRHYFNGAAPARIY
ncbi:MAG TPA: SpoIID/LytB domain-containing protein [Myxococcaceae bacterium]|nr:SpoIID/LytB domain-containing protein [Myxococcaceae bacterium]